MALPNIVVPQPGWLIGFVDWDRPRPGDEDKMGLVISLARENFRCGTGPPFGAAVFDRRLNLPVGVGVNLVRRAGNSLLHAETMALMSAQAGLGTFDLGQDEGRRYELVASSEPCAMCLGAAWYAGVRRVVYGTFGRQIRPYGFGLGPGLEELRRYLERNGFELAGGVMAEEALAVFTGTGERAGE